MTAYKTLNDAAVLGRPGSEDFKPGNTHIWYARNPTFTATAPIECDFLDRTHIRLGAIQTVDLERIFYLMQGEIWSPEGEARNLIRRLGLHHTSMSVGDVVVIDGATVGHGWWIR